MNELIFVGIGIVMGMYLIHSRARFIINRCLFFWYLPIWKNKYEEKVSDHELLEQIADDVQVLVSKSEKPIVINNHIPKDNQVKEFPQRVSWESSNRAKESKPVILDELETPDLSKIKDTDLVKELAKRGQVKAG